MMSQKQIESCMRLFKSYLTDNQCELNSLELQQKIIEEGLKAGLLFKDNLYSIPEAVIEEAKKQYGIDSEKWNQTFHKSFSTVRDTPIETLIAQQIIHYFTTYGLESLGLYNKDLVYIPHKQLDIPEIEEDIPLTVIKEITIEELTERLQVLLSSGIALSKQTIDDIMILSDYIDRNKFDEIKNREVKMALYEKYNIVPRNNIEFLRYLILKVTGSTLLIQNNSMIRTIKNLDDDKYELAYNLISSYKSYPNGYIKLAEIFLRYKNLFLAFKRDSKLKGHVPSMNKIINKISKLSKTYHKPLNSNILDRLSQVTSLYNIDLAELCNELDNCTIFREVRILNGLLYRLNANNRSIVYKVRNGKGYVKDLTKYISDSTLKVQNTITQTVKDHLVKRLNKTLKGKTVYIPNNITYAVPTSEKQFNGNIPEGSYIEIPRTKGNMVIGVHWTNLSEDDKYHNGRVDLDLHMQNRDEHYGWNSSYRSDNENFYFSGDVTDAPLPKGATEVFFIGRNCEERAFLLTLNDYTSNMKDIPFDFVIAEASDTSIDKNYVVDPNKILVTLPYKFEIEGNPNPERQITLGLAKITNTSIKFYFNDFTLGKSIVTRQNDVTKKAFDYLEASTYTQLKLNDLLASCDVTLLDQPYKEELVEAGVDQEGNPLYRKNIIKADYDLSIENINKDTLIQLLMEV